MVANCLSALQEIYTAEANISSETAARDREHLFSKAVIYSLLNRWTRLSISLLTWISSLVNVPCIPLYPFYHLLQMSHQCLVYCFLVVSEAISFSLVGQASHEVCLMQDKGVHRMGSMFGPRCGCKVHTIRFRWVIWHDEYSWRPTAAYEQCCSVGYHQSVSSFDNINGRHSPAGLPLLSVFPSFRLNFGTL